MVENQYFIFEAGYSTCAGTARRKGYRAFIASESEDFVRKRLEEAWVSIHRIKQTESMSDKRGIVSIIRDDDSYRY